VTQPAHDGCAEKRFVDFDGDRPNDHYSAEPSLAQFMQPAPGCLVTPLCCRPKALVPVLGAVTHYIARNHCVTGCRASWKMVPANTYVSAPHLAHSNRTVRTGQASLCLQRRHRNPFGQRGATR
jgi:hypothetical protein